MKILFLCNQYYPSTLPNGLCVKGIADELVRRGHAVHCISQLVRDTEPEGMVNGVHLHRIRGPFIDERIRKSKDGQISKAAKLLSRLKAFLLLPVWPMSAPGYTYRMVKRAEQLMNEERFDQVVACYGPIASLMTAYRLKKEHASLRYTAYFLDALSGGVTPRGLSRGFVFRKGTMWENLLLFNADDVVIMKAHEKHFRQAHPEENLKQKIRVMDIPLYRPFAAEDTHLRERKGIRIAYVGSLKRNLKNPDPFLRIYNMLPEMGIELHFYGRSDCDDFFENVSFEKNKVIRHGMVSHDEALRAIKEADILLNIGSRIACQIPCKIFEYLSMKKVIISTFSSEDEPSLPYLKDYEGSFLIDENLDPTVNANLLHAFLLRFRDIRISDKATEASFYLNTPEAFVEQIIDRNYR